jgi:phosphoribosyl 1,2-cyclic phosphate phosphodiesterase
MTLRFTVLGCGSSGGVPRPGAGWGACDPADARNRRRRCSLLAERIGEKGRTIAIVDTSPDLRNQLVDAGVTHLDGVLYSHDHADHTHGIDDLRPMVLHQRRVVDCYATAVTAQSLRERFGYIFTQPEGSDYPPIARLHPMSPNHPLTIDGPGGPMEALPFSMEHGPGYEALGFRFGGLAYASDVSHLDDIAKTHLKDLDVLIIDALRYRRHPSHFSLEEALALIAELKPKHGILTNMHVDLDYGQVSKSLPPHIVPAVDGMVITL